MKGKTIGPLTRAPSPSPPRKRKVRAPSFRNRFEISEADEQQKRRSHMAGQPTVKGGAMPQTKSKTSQAKAVRRARSPSPSPERNVRPKLEHPHEDAGKAREKHTVVNRSRPLLPQASTAGQQVAPGHIGVVQGVPSRVGMPATTHQDQPTKDTLLALAHLLVDTAEHPLYSDNLNRVLDGLSERADFTSALKLPFDVVMAKVDMQVECAEQKRNELKSTITKAWLTRILSHLGDILSATVDGYVQVEKETPHHRLELNVSHIVYVDGVRYEAKGPSEAMDEAKDEVKVKVESEDDSHYNGAPKDGNGDESGSEEDVEDAIEDGVIDRADNTNTTVGNNGLKRPPGLKVTRYKRVISQDTKLLLREPASPSQPSKYLRFSDEDVRAAVRGIQGSLHHHLHKGWSVNRYCKGHWCVNLTSTLDATFFVGLHVNIRGHRLQLARFQPRRSQVVVCNQISASLDWDRMLQDLAAAFPDRRFFASKSVRKLSRRKSVIYLLVTLDRPIDVEFFEFTVQKLSGEPWTASFNAWNEAPNCHICLRDHPVHRCPELTPLHPAGSRPANYLMKCPQVHSAVRGS